MTVDPWLVFGAKDGDHGVELWVTDGTRRGTFILRDIEPDGSSRPSIWGEWAEFALFTARDREHGSQLWRTDGTLEGTRPIAGGGQDVRFMGTVGGRALFVADYETQGRSLWGTDGTTSGTSVLAAGVFDTRNAEGGINGCPVETASGRNGTNHVVTRPPTSDRRDLH